MTSEVAESGWGGAHSQDATLGGGDKCTWSPVTEMSVRSVYTSIRSHKFQSRSKAESIWMRFSKGRNRKDFAGSVHRRVLRQSEALADASPFKIFHTGTARTRNRDGKGVVSQASAHLMNC